MSKGEAMSGIIERILKVIFNLFIKPKPPAESSIKTEEEMKMNHVQFAEEYEGVEIDFDNQFGAQCVDLVRFYWQKCFGLNRPQQPNTSPSGGARDLINNVVGAVANALRVRAEGEAPQPGDVAVWGAMPNNKWGHTAIVMEIGDGHIEVFEQDGLNQGRGAQWKVRPLTSAIRYICGV
jgi:hypothetical protein